MPQELNGTGSETKRAMRVIKFHAGKGMSYDWQGQLLEETPTMRKIKA